MRFRTLIATALALALFPIVESADACELIHKLKPGDPSLDFCWNDVCDDPQYANEDFCVPQNCDPCNQIPPLDPLPPECLDQGGDNLCWTGEFCDLIQKTSFQGGRWIIKRARYENPTVPVGDIVIDRVDVVSKNTRTGQEVKMAALAHGSSCPEPAQVGASTALSCNTVQFLIKYATKVCQDGTTTSCPKSERKLPIFDNFGDVEQLQRGIPVDTGKAVIHHASQKSPSFWFNVCCTGLFGQKNDVIEEDGYVSLRDPNTNLCQVFALRESGGFASDTWPDEQDAPVDCQPVN